VDTAPWSDARTPGLPAGYDADPVRAGRRLTGLTTLGPWTASDPVQATRPGWTAQEPVDSP
jgi:hypothetical protein